MNRQLFPVYKKKHMCNSHHHKRVAFFSLFLNGVGQTDSRTSWALLGPDTAGVAKARSSAQGWRIQNPVLTGYIGVQKGAYVQTGKFDNFCTQIRVCAQIRAFRQLKSDAATLRTSRLAFGQNGARGDGCRSSGD